GPDSPIGHRWDFSYNIAVERHGPHLNVRNGFGRIDTFRVAAPDQWLNPSFFRILERNVDGTYSLLFPDGGAWNFKPLDGSPAEGMIGSIVDRNGNAMTFSYDGAGRLVTIRDDLNRPYTLTYNTAGRLASVCDFTGRCWTYAYYGEGEAGGSPGDLKSVTTPAIVGTPNGNDFPDGRTVTYTYTTGHADDRLNHLLLTVTNARGTVYLWNSYDTSSPPATTGFGRLARQRWGGFGDIIDLVYVPVTPSEANNFASLRVIMNMRDGAVKEAFYNAANLGVMYQEYTGFADPDQPTTTDTNRPTGKLRASDPMLFEHRWSYEASGLVSTITFPSGAQLVRVYDTLNPDVRARGNMIERRRLAGPLGGDQTELVETFEYLAGGYGSCCGSSFLTRHVDPRGNAMNYTYDTRGNMLSAVGADPAGMTEWEYDAFGRVTARIHGDNGQGHRQRDVYSYYDSGPMNGYLKSVTLDAPNLAITTTYEYDALGRMIRAIDPAGSDSLVVLNQLGEAVREISRPVNLGGTRVVKDRFFDADANVTRVDIENRDYTGVLQANTHFTTTYTYDSLGRQLSSTREVDPSRSVTTEFVYDPNGLLLERRLGEAVNGNQPDNVELRSYDERGMLFRRTLKNGAEELIDQRDYNADRFVTRTIDAVGAANRVFSAVVDGFGRVRSSTDPMGNRVEFTYDANGNTVRSRTFGEVLDVPGSAGNVRMHELRVTFDEHNRPIRVEQDQFDPATGLPVGEGVRILDRVFSPSGQILMEMMTDGGTYEVLRDTAGRRISERLPSGVERRYTYNALGLVTRIEEEHPADSGAPPLVLVTVLEYSPDARLIRQTGPDGGVWQFGWDSRENRTRVVDPRGNITNKIIDGRNRTIEVRRILTDDGTGSGTIVGDITVQQEYDDTGRAVRRIDDLGRITHYTWDPLNRLVSVTHADGSTIVNEFNTSGELARTIDANGSIISHTYDARGRETRRDVVPGPGVAPDTTVETFDYNGLNHIVAFVNDATSVQRSLDSFGNVLAETINGVTITCDVDSDGNPVHCVYPSGRVFDYAYRPDGRTQSISVGGQVGAEFDYLGGIGLERVRFPRVPGAALISENRSYDTAGRLTRLTVALDDGAGGQSPRDDRFFTWDMAGNRTSFDDILPGGSGNTHDYGYDSANRLVRSESLTGMGEVDIDYVLDGVGNRTMVVGGNDAGAYAADPLNQYTSTPFDSRTYDAAGNTKLIDGAGTDVLLSWNYKHELVRWESTATGKVVTYQYDAIGRPVRRVETGAGGGTTLYHWLGRALAEESNTTSGQVRSYGYGAGDTRLLVTNAGLHHLHADTSGTVLAVTREDGAIAARYDYTDFGAPRNLMAPLVNNPRLFVGLWLDDDLGFYRAGRRFYEPRTGKFISRDPLGVWGDSAATGNGSLYAGANPWSRIDRTGLATETIWFGTPAEWIDLEFDDCTDSDHDDLISYIIGRTLAGVEDLEWDIQEDNEDIMVEEWFDGCGGVADESEEDDINDVVEDVEVSMEDKQLEIECKYSSGGCDAGVWAYVTSPNNEVRLCDPFFSGQSNWPDTDSWDNDLAQAVYFHELTHAYGGTDDEGYYTFGSGADGCPNYTIGGASAGIAADERDLRNNADSYAMMGLFGDPTIGTSESTVNGYFDPY
ncbi:MAG TPA: RHS repeat-associated core domain-containing protein, partial [Vicinamibacterales bacterium]|nr:RHS repeat-associated core domain-containing protein [Vicinamibacterales bacterium]